MNIRPFEYVPAAITNRSPLTYLGVRYETNGKDKVWKRTRFNGVTTSYYPDRTVVQGSAIQAFNGLSDVQLDEFMVLCPSSNPSVLADAGFNYGMASPLHVSARTETRRNKQVKLFSDSGGFQLISGASDWIDMDKLIEFYNRSIDYGIGLDIPTKAFLQDKYLMRMCKVMLANNDYLRGNAVPEVSIYDVSHGNTLKRRQDFLTQVLAHKKKVKLKGGGLAVGGIAQNAVGSTITKTTVNGVVNLTWTLLASKGQYERYHVLGTTNPFFQFLYHVLLFHKAAPHITADSTSWVLPAASNQVVTSKLEANHKLTTTVIPKDQKSFTLNCNCPICSMVKYGRELHVNYLSNTIHSLYVIGNQRVRIEEAAMEYLEGSKSLDIALTEVLGSVSKVEMMTYITCIKFAVDASVKGFDKAFKEYGPAFHSMLRKDKAGGLFAQAATKGQAEDGKRLDSILTAYEEFHKK